MTEYYEADGVYDAGELSPVDITTHPRDPYLMVSAGMQLGNAPSSGNEISGAPLNIYQGQVSRASSSPPSPSSYSSELWYAQHTASTPDVTAADQATVTGAAHAYASDAARAIAATFAAEAVAQGHHITAPRRFRATSGSGSSGGGADSDQALATIADMLGTGSAEAGVGGDQPIYFEARLEEPSQINPFLEAPSFAVPHKPANRLHAPIERDDFTQSLAHEWINTIGLYGPLGVPVAVVAPFNQDIIGIPIFSPDYFSSVPAELSGMTFQTPGMLLDTGSFKIP